MSILLSPLLNAAIFLGSHFIAGISVVHNIATVLLVASAALILFHLSQIRKNILYSAVALPSPPQVC